MIDNIADIVLYSIQCLLNLCIDSGGSVNVTLHTEPTNEERKTYSARTVSISCWRLDLNAMIQIMCTRFPTFRLKEGCNRSKRSSKSMAIWTLILDTISVNTLEGGLLIWVSATKIHLRVRWCSLLGRNTNSNYSVRRGLGSMYFPVDFILFLIIHWCEPFFVHRARSLLFDNAIFADARSRWSWQQNFEGFLKVSSVQHIFSSFWFKTAPRSPCNSI